MERPYAEDELTATTLNLNTVQVYLALATLKKYASNLNYISRTVVEISDLNYHDEPTNIVVRFNIDDGHDSKSHYLRLDFSKDINANGFDDPWYLDKLGTFHCGMQYIDIIDGKSNYDSCPCPKTYVDACRGLTSIVKEASKVNIDELSDIILKKAESFP